MTAHSFKGKWITTAEMAALPVYNVFHRELDKSNPPNPHADVNNRHILFRRKFLVGKVKPTVIHISADDYYKLYINGRFVAQGPTAAYPANYNYNTVDITEFLLKGENTVAVHTYYQGLSNRVWVSGDNRHGLIFDIVCGDETLLATDESFKTHLHTAYSACGIVGYHTQFMERYDARAPETDFFRPDFDDDAWENAVINTKADYGLRPQASRQLVFETIRPADIRQTATGWQIDFGGIWVGYLALVAQGEPGSVVTMKFGQELNDDGTVREKLRANCVYVEEMVLSGKCDLLNEYDFKSFRYVELVLPAGATVALDKLRVIARHYPFELKADCKYADEKSRAVWKLCVDSLHYGVQEVIQDCMEREKGYYLGDGCYTMLTYCLLTKDYTLMEKFFDDFLETSFINRGLMTCGACSMMQEIAEYPLMMLTLLLPYLKLTGNTQFVAERFDKFADILDFYHECYAESDGLLNNLDKWSVVEWPKNFQDGYDADISSGKICTDKHVAINAYYVGAVKCLNTVARIIGRPAYKDAAPLQKAFVDAFYDAEKHLFRDRVGSEHVSMPGNVYPAFYGLLPDDGCKAAILAMVREKRWTAGSLFVPFPLLVWLVRDGEDELVHDLLTDEHGWLNIIAEGGTRTFEGWGKDCKWNTSLFHLTESDAAAFMVDWPLAEAYAMDK